MTTWADEAEKHLHELRSLYRITRVPVKDYQKAWANSDEDEIHAPKVRKKIDYLVNLHEMGHVVSPTSHRYSRRYHDDPFSECMAEAAAWAWAVFHAEPGLVASIPEADWVEMGNLLVGYFRNAAGTRHVSEPDSEVD